MTTSSAVRPASAQDAAACVPICRPYVQNTAISWEIDVPTVGEIAAHIGALRATQQWLVLERDDRIIGFAYGRPLKCLAAFQWATETGMSTSPSTAPAEYASSTPTGKPSPAHPATASIDPPGYPGRDLLDTAPARMDQLARPSPPPQVGCGSLKIRKDVRPSEPGHTKV